ncbi:MULTISPECIES: thiamine pyrophosphate-requiring protein [Rhizobium]|uniref:Acetolactate synthase-1/2/3 large subunit n=1 Tax=Rhizobium esperanzae TaxID=1967781 RepID=A0A7W6XV57_9HYPH|nr:MULTISPECIES: thiamine pyrophosphate-requiring protein [Rhizobium]MBB4440138.1 acetolactate synthase-1/2/3 large subunit [Rhizobium esperanzae]MDH6202297.1 thiamine pyrophosphate-dependent acetolactate synthase large subunit-like protein [Rhizobium leguminosarum]OAV54334.1 decarboxylase [Rhizobium sp. WYCCWR10014]
MADGTHALPNGHLRTETMSGAEYIAGVLKEEGVKQIIGFPASELFDASAALDIPPLIARTQRVAVNIAEGYARATAGKELAVVTVQYGPGAESAFAGIAQAFNDRVPMLFLPTGYPRGSEAIAPNFESRRNFRHITKWCEAATQVDDLPKLMHAAISRVRNGPPAPVLLELPVDLLAERLDALPTDHRRPRRSVPQAGEREVVDLVESLLSAKTPVILAGQGVLSASATPELVELAELLNIPVMTTPNGKSAFPEDHPLALGTAGRARPATVDHFLEKADVVFALGSSLTRSYYILPVPDDKAILQVTLDEADLGKDYAVAQGVVADAASVLKQMIALIRRDYLPLGERQQPAAEIAAIRAAFMEKWMPLLTSDSMPISPYRVVWEIMQAIDPKTSIVTHDAGNPRDQFCPFYVATTPGSYIGWGKTTQLGSGLGFAIGAKLARPDATVVNLMGESAFGMVGIDFETAVRCNLPVLTIVLRNNVLGGYAKSMPIATTKYGANQVTGNYAPIAEALGGHGECVRDPAQLRPALLRALAKVKAGQAALVEVVTHEEPRLAGLR